MTTEGGLTDAQRERVLALRAAGLPLLDELDAMVRERGQAIYEQGRTAGRAEVGGKVQEWAMKNEIAAPPLDWGWLGEILRWAAPELHEDDVEVSR